MDCVTDAGDAAILYCATLRWRGLHATMGSLLTSQGPVTETHSSMARYRLSTSAGELLVEHSGLNVSGRWQATREPVKRTVYECPAGSVVWNCHQPGSLVNLRIGERELTGLGYAECLTLTLPPWRLPMRQLRWGRFVSQENSLAWIDWRGSYSTSFAVLNGRQYELLAASDAEVVLNDAILRMDESISLRSGRLGSTILPGLPKLAEMFPHNLLNVSEQKWRSRGTLTGPGDTSVGWVIHEVVHWDL